MIDEEKCSIGVGDGNGNLFVHGTYESVKAVQTIILNSAEKDKQIRVLLDILANNTSLSTLRNN